MHISVDAELMINTTTTNSINTRKGDAKNDDAALFDRTMTIAKSKGPKIEVLFSRERVASGNSLSLERERETGHESGLRTSALLFSRYRRTDLC